MFIWGRNNNHLFKQNHKKTYSLPQKLPINRPVFKTAPGYDYILILTSMPGNLICFYQSAFYQLYNQTSIIDVATTDNMIVTINSKGQAWIMEFSADKVMNGQLTASKIPIAEQVFRVEMNYNDIFIQAEQAVYHLKRNQWYQTKTYTDPTKILGLQGLKILSIAPGIHHNYFLTEQGSVFTSQKSKPTHASHAHLPIPFIDITASEYLVGVGTNGRLYIWGTYNSEHFDSPTQFGKITQTFRTVRLAGDNGFAITTTGQCWVWGKNANGQLGISDYQPRQKPFPLVTMDKEIKNIYIGQNYIVCTVQSSKSHKNKPKNFAQQFHLNINSENTPLSAKKSAGKVSAKKEKKDMATEYSSMKVRKQEKRLLKQHSKGVATEVLRNNSDKKHKNGPKTPKKQNDKAIFNVTSSLSRSKSPLSKSCKSPYLEHVRSNSHSNIKKKEWKGGLNRSSKSPLKELSQERAKYRKAVESKQKMLSSKIKDLLEENEKLTKIVLVKDRVIEDITTKIQLLEEAIEEHEKTLTARDSMMEEYQRRQKEYTIHIDELEKHIETLIQGKHSQDSKEHIYNDMYNSLKLDFAKEKEYFMQKMAQHQEQLRNQRNHYKNRIKDLEEEISTFRSHHREHPEKENRNLDMSYSRENYSLSGSYVGKPLEESALRVNGIISRIEDSKVRIAKSANKLYQMIEQN